MTNQTLFVLLSLTIVLRFSHVSANGCPRGSFWDSSTSQCTLCPPGSYQHAINSTSCILCDAGKYLTHAGAQSPAVCRGCPAGTFSLAGSSSCTPCPEGKFSSELSPRCFSCPTGTHISHWSWSHTGEEPCETCHAGYADEENLLECKPCPPGSAAPPGATSIEECAACPAGTDSDGYNSCHECYTGSFSDEPGTSCRPCPAGWESEKEFGSTKCVPCQPGQFGGIGEGLVSFSRVRKCFACPEGTMTYAPGRRFCRRVDGPCPSGYIQTSTGDCERCEADERYDLELEKCTPCPRAEGSVGGLPLQCAPCAEVARAKVEGSHCTPLLIQTCASGTYLSNSSECLPCPEGTVSTEYGATSCEPCPEGMIPDRESIQCVDRLTNCPIDTQLVSDPISPDNTLCESEDCSVAADGSYSCPPCTGWFSDTYSFDGCEPCPGNEVRGADLVCRCRGPLAQNLGMINGICSECPAGSYGEWVAGEDYNECVVCPAGTYRVVASYDRMLCAMLPRCRVSPPCVKCAAGFVTRRDGATDCEQCPPGTFSYGIGDTECLSFGAPSGAVEFNHPLDLEVQREHERIPEWWHSSRI